MANSHFQFQAWNLVIRSIALCGRNAWSEGNCSMTRPSQQTTNRSSSAKSIRISNGSGRRQVPPFLLAFSSQLLLSVLTETAPFPGAVQSSKADLRRPVHRWLERGWAGKLMVRQCLRKFGPGAKTLAEGEPKQNIRWVISSFIEEKNCINQW